jgi:hypothetical protein
LGGADAARQRLSRLRIPYGLDRLPRDLGLRSVEVGDRPLRLNSEPVPADAMPLATGDHVARVAAAVAWLESQCGDYAPLRRQFIAAYLRCVAAQIEAHRVELAERLKPYDGLYAPEDFLWSALRPLPRGWVPLGERYLPADVVLWDGTKAIAIELGGRDTEKQKVLLAAGVEVFRVEPGAFDRLPELLPAGFRHFWNSETLPMSPFRRAMPNSPVIASAVKQPRSSCARTA